VTRFLIRHSGESRNPECAGVTRVRRFPDWIPAFAGMTRRGAFTGIVARMKQPCVYLLTNDRNGTLYIGVTSDLIQRIWQHKEGVVDGFSKKYGLKMLVWFELHSTMESAIAKEKAMKEWKRGWKLELIEKANPEWRDLYEDLLG